MLGLSFAETGLSFAETTPASAAVSEATAEQVTMMASSFDRKPATIGSIISVFSSQFACLAIPVSRALVSGMTKTFCPRLAGDVLGHYHPRSRIPMDFVVRKIAPVPTCPVRSNPSRSSIHDFTAAFRC